MIMKLKLARGAECVLNSGAVAAVIPGTKPAVSTVIGMGFREEVEGDVMTVAALIWGRDGWIAPGEEPAPAAGSEAPPA